jgi:hypothetical protein
VNRERLAWLRELQFGDWAQEIRRMPCAVCSHPPPNEAHHTRSRGAGGTKKALCPLCIFCHAELHALGAISFNEKYGVDLRQKAAELWNGRNG